MDEAETGVEESTLVATLVEKGNKRRSRPSKLEAQLALHKYEAKVKKFIPHLYYITNNQASGFLVLVVFVYLFFLLEFKNSHLL